MATYSSILAWRMSLDRVAWWATVYGVTKSRTRLSDFHSLTHSWHIRASLIAQLVKNPPAMQETPL